MGAGVHTSVDVHLVRCRGRGRSHERGRVSSETRGCRRSREHGRASSETPRVQHSHECGRVSSETCGCGRSHARGRVSSAYTNVNLLSESGYLQRPPSLLTLLMMKWWCQHQMKASSGPWPRFQRPAGTWRSRWWDIKKKNLQNVMHSGRMEEQKGECERWVQVPYQRNWGHSSDSDFKKQVDRNEKCRR